MTAKKFCSLLLAGWMLIGSMSGCGTLPGMEETTPQETEEAPTVLTHIYAGTELVCPDNINHQFTEFLYASEDSITFFSATDWRTGNGTEDVLLTYPLSGGKPTVETAPIRNPKVISAFEGGLVYILEKTSASGSTFSLHIRMDDGQEQVVEDLPQIDNTLTHVIRDPEGYIYVLMHGKILVLTPELEIDFAVPLGYFVASCALSKDGQVYVAYEKANPSTGKYELVYAPVDKTARAMGEPLSLPEGAKPKGYLMGPGYDVYYYDEIGIYGYNTGDPQAVLLLHFENSRISVTLFQDLVQAIIEDTFLLRRRDYNTGEYVFEVYTAAPDLDLTGMTVLELAMLNSSSSIRSYVAEFNKKNPDIQIVLKDYSEYSTDENPTGGSTRLGNEILNGIYVPDMILGSYTQTAVKAVVENDLFLDMNALLDGEDGVNRADILGCVLNTFRKDDRIFGLPMRFTCDTIVANRELTAGIETWDIEAMMDFIQDLPDGVLFMDAMSRENASYNLLGENGYSTFIDFEKGTCSFTGEGFIAYLEYLKSLPLTAEPLRPTDQFGSYRTGEVIAWTHSYGRYVDFVREKMMFGDDNMTYLGFPDKSGSGVTTVSPSYSLFMILQSTDSPEGCWNFISYSLQKGSTSSSPMSFTFPVLRRALYAGKEEVSQKYFHFNGADLTQSAAGSTPGGCLFIGDVRGYEIDLQFTDEDMARMEQFLDNAGTPITANALPADVSAIINEELSAYLGSTKSAEACADMIQSRVSIYLAEHN